MNNKIVKLQLGNYFLWNNLSREDKVKRNKQIALLYLDKGPSILNYYNALKAYFGGFNPKNPYLITGEAPTPGKVNMSLYRDAKYLLKGPLYDERFVNFVDKLAKGKINPEFITNKKVSPINYNYVDLKSETIPKGFIKGNEITPVVRYPLSEEGLTIRTVKPINLENPINNEAEALAAKDWMATYGRKGKYKNGGIFKAEEGTSTSKWLKFGNTLNKVGNFISNSGLGEVALNALSTYTLNKLIGSDSDITKALVDKDKAFRILQANLAAELEARNIQLSNINPENPNAMGGDIVKNFIKNKLLSLKMALINLESDLEKAEIDWQTLLLKNLNTTSMWTGIGNILYLELGHVGLYMGNKL